MKRLLTLVLLLVSVALMAQKGSVKGFVYDKATGEVIPFATVKIEGTDFGAATDDQGFFNIPNLAVGSYKVVVTYIGYETQIQEIEITKGKTVNLKVYSSVQSRELQDVEINAERQQKLTES